MITLSIVIVGFVVTAAILLMYYPLSLFGLRSSAILPIQLSLFYYQVRNSPIYLVEVAGGLQHSVLFFFNPFQWVSSTNPVFASLVPISFNYLDACGGSWFWGLITLAGLGMYILFSGGLSNKDTTASCKKMLFKLIELYTVAPLFFSFAVLRTGTTTGVALGLSIATVIIYSCYCIFLLYRLVYSQSRSVDVS